MRPGLLPDKPNPVSLRGTGFGQCQGARAVLPNMGEDGSRVGPTLVKQGMGVHASRARRRSRLIDLALLLLPAPLAGVGAFLFAMPPFPSLGYVLAGLVVGGTGLAGLVAFVRRYRRSRRAQ